jgi:hypothetical protein
MLLCLSIGSFSALSDLDSPSDTRGTSNGPTLEHLGSCGGGMNECSMGPLVGDGGCMSRATRDPPNGVYHFLVAN